MTTIQIAVIILAVIAGALTGYILTMRYMIGFVGREYEKTNGHHRRLTDVAYNDLREPHADNETKETQK